MKDIVSLWLGNFEDEEALEAYLEIDDEDDDDAISQFEEDFALDYYDEDCREISWHESKEKSLETLLGDHSYSDQILAKIKAKIKPYNSVILLYNYDFDEEIKKAHGKKYKIEYIGKAEYEW